MKYAPKINMAMNITAFAIMDLFCFNMGITLVFGSCKDFNIFAGLRQYRLQQKPARLRQSIA